jgi:hypothetical protein
MTGGMMKETRMMESALGETGINLSEGGDSRADPNQAFSSTMFYPREGIVKGRDREKSENRASKRAIPRTERDREQRIVVMKRFITHIGDRM